ncbi:MAG: ribonuclease P protein component [Gemmatimonadetes bacterium]|nr:ribonuclease P protein component [Gemmatimonadota bacterium]
MAHPGAGAPGGHRLPPSRRIGRAGDIRTLLRRGKRKKTSLLDVFFLSSPVSHSRLGLIVPKHRRTAVARNRLKRRLREMGRREVLPRLAAADLPLDVLIRARREAYAATYQKLRIELVRVTEELCSQRPSWG